MKVLDSFPLLLVAVQVYMPVSLIVAELSSKTEVTVSVPFKIVAFEYTTSTLGESWFGVIIVQLIIGLGTPVAEHIRRNVVSSSPYTSFGE